MERIAIQRRQLTYMDIDSASKQILDADPVPGPSNMQTVVKGAETWIMHPCPTFQVTLDECVKVHNGYAFHYVVESWKELTQIWCQATHRAIWLPTQAVTSPGLLKKFETKIVDWDMAEEFCHRMKLKYNVGRPRFFNAILHQLYNIQSGRIDIKQMLIKECPHAACKRTINSEDQGHFCGAIFDSFTDHYITHGVIQEAREICLTNPQIRPFEIHGIKLPSGKGKNWHYSKNRPSKPQFGQRSGDRPFGLGRGLNPKWS